MSTHTYEIVIGAPCESVWKAITDGEVTRKYYYNTSIESDWKVGSCFRYCTPDGSVLSEGTIIEAQPQSHLKMSWQASWLGNVSSTLIWDLQPLGSITLLKLTHMDIDDAIFEEALMHQGWIFILSSMKSLLETGKALPAVETAW